METTQIQQLAVYTRDYSPIEGLQRAHSLHYLLEKDRDQLRVRVVCTGAKEDRAAVCRLRGISIEYAGGLLKFLYENAVPVEQAAEVLQDLCGDLAEQES